MTPWLCNGDANETARLNLTLRWLCGQPSLAPTDHNASEEVAARSTSRGQKWGRLLVHSQGQGLRMSPC